MRLYVIRHGETSWNVARRLQGHAGADLDEKGVRLAEETARALACVPFDLCISSPLIRALHTARIIVGKRPIPILEDPRIMEISFGQWEGLCIAPDHYEIPGDGFAKFHTDPFGYVAPPGGETIGDVCRRTGEFLREVIHTREYEDKTLLISTHGCALRGLLNSVYEDPKDFWHGGVAMNCAVSIVDVKEGKPHLIQSDKIYYDASECVNYYAAAERSAEETAAAEQVAVEQEAAEKEAADKEAAEQAVAGTAAGSAIKGSIL